MIYFSRKSDNFQDFIKFWGFVGTKKLDKICHFSINITERDVISVENFIFSNIYTENKSDLIIFHQFH